MTTLLREAAAAPKPKRQFPRFPPPAHRRRWGVLFTWVREGGDGYCCGGYEPRESRPWWLLGLVLIITRPGPRWQTRYLTWDAGRKPLLLSRPLLPAHRTPGLRSS